MKNISLAVCMLSILLFSCKTIQLNSSDDAFELLFPGSELVEVNTIETVSKKYPDFYAKLKENQINEGRFLTVNDLVFDEGTTEVFIGKDNLMFRTLPKGGIRMWLKDIRNLEPLSRYSICFSGKCITFLAPGKEGKNNCTIGCSNSLFTLKQLEWAQLKLSTLPPQQG